MAGSVSNKSAGRTGTSAWERLERFAQSPATEVDTDRGLLFELARSWIILNQPFAKTDHFLLRIPHGSVEREYIGVR
jgi:hypothetical protein